MSDWANKARQRNWLLMRLVGSVSLFGNRSVVTPKEALIMAEIHVNILKLINSFSDNSKQLGFKVKDKVEKQWD